MTQRALPQRTTRGKLPTHLREVPEPPKRQRKQFKTQPIEAQRKQMENRLRTQQVANLRKYPFCRAVHYFFDLDSFPRTPGHISYVIDEQNALKNSFSNDRNELNAITYGEVLNRKMFGLPFSPRSEITVKKESRFKNICWGYLFDIEDKKYQNDKLVSILKVVLSKLKKGSSIESLRKIEVLRKDVELQSIFDDNTPKEQKLMMVEQRLETQINRKYINYSSWQSDDQLYYYHSLNQRLHNQILEIKQHLTQEYFVKSILQSLNSISQAKSHNKYYFSQQPVTSSSKIKRNFPINIMHFKGGSKLLKLAGQIVAKRCQSLGQTTYYQVRQAVKNIFGFQISLKPDRSQSYGNYQKLFRKKCEQIRKMSLDQPIIEQSPDLGNFCRNGALSFRNKIQITGKQYHLIIIFYWLCIALQQLSPILRCFPQILQIISSDYFIKMYSYLVQVIDSAKVGVMCVAIESVAECFSKPDPLGTIPVQLSFEYEVNLGVGLLFGQELTCQSQMTDNSLQRQGKITPSKKLKRDRS